MRSAVFHRGVRKDPSGATSPTGCAPAQRQGVVVLLLPAVLFFLLTPMCCNRPSQKEAADGRAETHEGKKGAASVPEDVVLLDRGPCPDYTETGDLDAIRKRGFLRILARRKPAHDFLPRNVDDPYEAEWEMIGMLGSALGVRVEIVAMPDVGERIQALLDGKGDIAEDFILSGEKPDDRVIQTVAIRRVQGLVVTKAGDTRLCKPSDLAGRRLVISADSPFVSVARRLQQTARGLSIDECPEGTTADVLVQKVVDGAYDAAVIDSAWLGVLKRMRDDFRTAFDLGTSARLHGLLRPNATMLQRFINSHGLRALSSRDLPNIYRGDLPEIKEHGVLRVLTSNDSASYYISHGQLVGFEYDLASKFAKEQKIRIRMVVPPALSDLIPWLLQGRGDMIAADMTVLASRQVQGVAFSRPYNHVVETVVGRIDEPEMSGPDALAGRTIVVQRSSSYWETVEELRKKGVKVKIVAAPEELDTEQMIGLVADGTYDLTVADNNLLDIELTWRSDVKPLLALTEPRPIAWIVRQTDQELLAAINGFLQREEGGPFLAVLMQRYFAHRPAGSSKAKAPPGDSGISPYDRLAKGFGAKYEFDWRMISAQMYHESRFNPKALSPFGAVGLLQVLPSTAREVGFTKDLTKPEIGLHAGVKYLSCLRKRFDPSLPMMDLLAFCLASYNAGPGRLAEARSMTKQRGLDPNRWYGNVENTMVFLSTREGSKVSRLGYCRCMEPVNYVRNIQDLYQFYLRDIHE